ncbi:MAG: cadherin-like domain-containing protein, partial [Psychrosphaera sp.]|nr:cadherin-like domain-containing protein [Psychrosphaera sp.]
MNTKPSNWAVRTFLLLLATLFTTQQAFAFNSGISGRSKSSSTCNSCHSGGSFGSSIEIQGDTSVAPNTDHSYIISLTHSASAAGFNLSASDGTLSATDSGTKTLSGELTHTTAKNASSGTTQWSFQWTAPSTDGAKTLFVCGNPVNGNGNTSGDESNTPCTTLSVTVVSNASPVANDDSASVNEDSSVDIDVTSNDTDSDGTVDRGSISIVTGVTNGSTSINNSTGLVTYTPTANFNGSDSFTYFINDNEQATSGLATVTITVNSVNDSPTASNDSATTNEDVATTIAVLSNDSDVDGSLSTSSVVITANPTNGSASVNSSGEITYSPNANFNGSDSVSYTVDDNNGATSNVATVSISITSVNDVPVAANDATSTDEDNAVTVNVLANDSDIDGTLDSNSVNATSTPTNGSLTVSGGNITYTPNSDYNGSASFTYTVSDNEGGVSNAATVTVTVNAVNDAPVANTSSATTSEDQDVVISLSGSDIDGDALTFSLSG